MANRVSWTWRQMPGVYAAWGAVVALAGAAGYALMGVVTPWLGAERTFGAVGLIVGLGGPLLLWAMGAVASVRGQGGTAEVAGGRA